MKERPKVGIGVLVLKDNKVLLGLRKNAHGDGDWSFPGGHLEFFESLEECAKREVTEETGLEIEDIKKGPYTNDMFTKEEKHYITIFMLSKIKSGEAKVMEPEKCEKWEWFDWDNLPQNLFIPIKNLKETGFNPFKK